MTHLTDHRRFGPHGIAALSALLTSLGLGACGERPPDEDASPAMGGMSTDASEEPAASTDTPTPTSTGEPSPTSTGEPAPTGGAGGAGPAPSGSGGGGDMLQWYSTCGDPVCGPMPTDLGLPACDSAAAVGGRCTTADERCDAELGCGAALVCAATDPKTSPGGCPISRARYKTDIEYLSEAERSVLAERLLATPLATYRYKAAPGDAWQLGFIIEDVEPSPSVDSERDRVNLYGYTSMVVAALQEQQQQLEHLEAEVARLRAECGR